MYQQHLQMLQEQQLQEQQQKLVPSNPNIELPDGVEEIKEVENEETPNQELQSNEMSNDIQESEQENEIDSEQEVPPQINVKAPAKFRMEEEEEEDSKTDQPLEYYDGEGNINPEVLQSLSPEQLYQLQQLQAQQEPSEMSEQQFDPNDPQNLAAIDQMMRMSHQNELLQKELQSTKPLSKSVSKVIKRFKSMRKYELDVYDKKFQTELRKAQRASNRGEYFQEILRQSLESALSQRGLDGKGIISKTNNLSKFVTPLMQYCDKDTGLKSFGDLYQEYANTQLKAKLQKSTKSKTSKRHEKVLKRIKEAQFQESLYNKQKSRLLKRDAMQAKINRKLETLASKLEKEKILEEKKQLKYYNKMLADEKQIMMEAFTKYFDDQITSTKERIEEEKLAKSLIEKAEIQATSAWKKELNKRQNKKLERLFNRLDQEDERYEVENLDYDKMEQKLITMYKRF